MRCALLAVFFLFSGSAALARRQCASQIKNNWEPSSIPGRRLHVDSSAGGGGDGSSQTPFNTIPSAIAVATGGDAVVVHPGNGYSSGLYLTDVRGTSAAAPIWLGGAPGEAKPVVSGQASGNALQLVRPAWLIVHDLEVTNPTGANGISCDDGTDYNNEQAAHHVIFRNIDFHDVGTGGNSDCLKLSGLNDHHVIDNTFTGCSTGGSAVDHVGCHRGLIARNTFVRNGNGVQAKGSLLLLSSSSQCAL
jgi:hypothetical protein